ncbi:MAG: RNase adapter RapZ [Clostridiales bacterium]|nr:RNase adapter RapZ [Clostridiales bacterium]
MELVVITGLSGAGKSRGVNALEDIGFFCADNMPPKLISTFVKLILDSKEQRQRVAIVTDIRLGSSFNDLFNALSELRAMGIKFKMLFFDADNKVLLHRFKETRRKHPLIDEFKGSLIDAIEAERVRLQPARQIADYVVDTSNLSAMECRERVTDMFLEDPSGAMLIHCISFGYKYGIPTDSDLVFDVRCLPNPFYKSELKNKTGLDKEVFDYVMQKQEALTLRDKLLDLLDFLIPLYRSEGKSQLVVSIGCTGGRHRSVVFSQILRDYFADKDYLISVNHRDIEK